MQLHKQRHDCSDRKKVNQCSRSFFDLVIAQSLGERFGSVTSSDWVQGYVYEISLMLLIHDMSVSWVSRLHHVCSSFWIPHCDNRAGRISSGLGTPEARERWISVWKRRQLDCLPLAPAKTKEGYRCLFPASGTRQWLPGTTRLIHWHGSERFLQRRCPSRRPPGRFPNGVAMCARQLAPERALTRI